MQEVQFVGVIEQVRHTDEHIVQIPFEGTNPKVTHDK